VAGRDFVLSPNDVTVVAGRFPQPHAYVVSVCATPPRTDEGDDLSTLSALLLADGQGNISASLDDVGVRLDAFTLRHLVDVDGDGVDEVHYGSQYYEGGYEHVVVWDGNTPAVLTIAGDGA
jgi:hypothetical protein